MNTKRAIGIFFVMAIIAIWAARASARPGQHTVTVTLNYDFSVDNAVTTGCIKQFNIYDLTPGAAPLKLFSITAPAGANFAVTGITGTSALIDLKAGAHTLPPPLRWLTARSQAQTHLLLLQRWLREHLRALVWSFSSSELRVRPANHPAWKHIVTWRNGSTTRFGHCRNENDVYQYQGAEFLFIGIDELTHFTLKQWQFLTSRNRCAFRGTTPCMAGATNPGNIGHAWVKSLWVDKLPPSGYESPELYDPPITISFAHASRTTRSTRTT